MPCRSGDTGRELRSCGSSRASEGAPSDETSSDIRRTRKVSHLNEFFCEPSNLTLRNTPCHRHRSCVLLHLCEVSRHVTLRRRGDRIPWDSRNTGMA
jgi:hypothetical protein